MATPALSATR
ncbi:hypothetical protein YPPY65_1652, partial [Yersinia pestis PY-65]